MSEDWVGLPKIPYGQDGGNQSGLGPRDLCKNEQRLKGKTILQHVAQALTARDTRISGGW